MQSIVSGRRSLAFTYWVCYAIPGAFLLLISYAFVALSTRIAAFDLVAIDVLQIIITVIAVFIVYVMGFAVIRSARNTHRMGFWGWVATIVVVIGMIRTPFDIMGMTQTDEEIGKQITLMNTGLPQRVDEITSLESIRYGNGAVTYFFVIDDTYDGVVDVDLIKGEAIRNNCESWQRMFEQIRTLYFHYSLRGQVRSFSITPEDCG